MARLFLFLFLGIALPDGIRAETTDPDDAADAVRELIIGIDVTQHDEVRQQVLEARTPLLEAASTDQETFDIHLAWCRLFIEQDLLDDLHATLDICRELSPYTTAVGRERVDIMTMLYALSTTNHGERAEARDLIKDIDHDSLGTPAQLFRILLLSRLADSLPDHYNRLNLLVRRAREAGRHDFELLAAVTIVKDAGIPIRRRMEAVNDIHLAIEGMESSSRLRMLTPAVIAASVGLESLRDLSLSDSFNEIIVDFEEDPERAMADALFVAVASMMRQPADADVIIDRTESLALKHFGPETFQVEMARTIRGKHLKRTNRDARAYADLDLEKAWQATIIYSPRLLENGLDIAPGIQVIFVKPG